MGAAIKRSALGDEAHAIVGRCAAPCSNHLLHWSLHLGRVVPVLEDLAVTLASAAAAGLVVHPTPDCGGGSRAARRAPSAESPAHRPRHRTGAAEAPTA